MMRIFSFGSLALFMGALFILNCAEDTTTNPQFDYSINYNNYPIQYVDFEDRLLYSGNPASLDFNFLHDEENIQINEINGQYVYHPWNLANNAIAYICSFYSTGDSAYLDMCYRYANKFSELGVRHKGGIYIPYTWNYHLHPPSNDILMAPWYSGIAEGYFLIFFSEFYEITGDLHIKALADSVFYTFLNADNTDDIWTCMVDSLGYYWVEEYPFSPPDHVFGGFTTGLIGLHTYYMVTNDQGCKMLLKAGLTTIQHYFNEYRNPGDIMYYCLRHHLQLGNYHLLNADRLRYLAIISGDDIFDQFADSILADYSG